MVNTRVRTNTRTVVHLWRQPQNVWASMCYDRLNTANNCSQTPRLSGCPERPQVPRVGGNFPDAESAQMYADQSALVLVVFANPNPHEPGHIAIVRPSEKSSEALERNGPQIIQAGTHNQSSTTVRTRFLSHPKAWPNGVRYDMHRL